MCCFLPWFLSSLVSYQSWFTIHLTNFLQLSPLFCQASDLFCSYLVEKYIKQHAPPGQMGDHFKCVDKSLESSCSNDLKCENTHTHTHQPHTPAPHPTHASARWMRILESISSSPKLSFRQIKLFTLGDYSVIWESQNSMRDESTVWREGAGTCTGRSRTLSEMGYMWVLGKNPKATQHLGKVIPKEIRVQGEPSREKSV